MVASLKKNNQQKGEDIEGVQSDEVSSNHDSEAIDTIVMNLKQEFKPAISVNEVSLIEGKE